MKKILLALAFVLGIIGALYIVYREGVLPVDKNDTSGRIVVVRRGETVNSIANTLYSQKLIRNRVVFFLVVKQLGIEKQIQAGDFNLTPSMSAFDIATALTKGSIDIWVTIPEGLRKEEVAEIFAKDLPAFSASNFLSEAEEGYLFPDTYLIPKGADSDMVIDILTKTFEQKYTPEMAIRARRLGLTDREVVTLASLIEREALFAQDRQPVASVLLRRLKEPMRLQIDATVQYAIGYSKEEKTWWKKGLTVDDLKFNSPYNTYVSDGIPPGPICNPGIAAIEAVLAGDINTPYLYYVNDVNGKLHFAKTLAEHEANIRKYVRSN
ncbi:MAG TPA: endolytic transglycosylase MltG [Candidatus Woesebacteria bacterium]|nr:endolytic transglycosylase MltG [Candidatus Woesebacteria bacterium]HNS94608.1 endolytic transglycosylase MltG [Candidatus Woesebacteria bacterium]